MCFLIEDDDLVEKYTVIQDKLSADVKKKIDSKLLYNKEFLKTKIKSRCNEVTDFCKKTPKVNSNHTYLGVIALNSALKKDGNYYMQAFLKECKYIKKKVVRHIVQDLESQKVLMMILTENKLNM